MSWSPEYARPTAVEACVLLVAKAPCAGSAKTRLTPFVTGAQAADIAAAALLDTLDAVSASGARSAVALAGDLRKAARADEVQARLDGGLVFAQRGTSFGSRLAHAHVDGRKRHPYGPLLQIGMDTPQVDADMLDASMDPLRSGGADGVLGLATDGGWWALGLRDVRHAELLKAVPMSRPDTGECTLSALRAVGLRIHALPVLTDVDTIEDAREVAALVPESRFARALAAAMATVSDTRSEAGVGA